MIMYQPWLVAATVAAFATRAMWVKFRQIRLAARNQKQKHGMKLLGNRQNNPSEVQDDDQNDSETEAESEGEGEGECEAECEAEDEDEGAPAVKQDELLQHLQTDAGPNCRPIES